MEYNDDRFEPIPPEPEQTPEPVEEPIVSEVPEAEAEPADTAYRGAGVGQREAYSAAPAEPVFEPDPIPAPDPEPEPEPAYERRYTASWRQS